MNIKIWLEPGKKWYMPVHMVVLSLTLNHLTKCLMHHLSYIQILASSKPRIELRNLFGAQFIRPHPHII